ncbi:4-oxalocrotonate tautomerase [Streptomyces sp. SID10853]|uniref:tautomerase family protein n=1 Tax=Streptomyces sp. SID10853 TaxID=2706028 RepID=UPI0013C2960E|nr:tautomerase family protein [Streptomyces sp. SID10853]NDZ78624.1 4-oxalocrotonate tautomerase [Streptomyces sp. SID10853]
MPIIQVTLVKGRDDEKIRACVRELARTAARTLDAPLESVRVMVHETEPDRFAVGDRLKSDG